MDKHNGESFLNRLYKDLHMSEEVIHTAIPSDTKDEKVRKYLDRLEKVEKLARNSKYNGIELLKEMYYRKYVIKPENVPKSYFEKQKEIALERGFGHVSISNNEREQMIETIINDQKKSLDIWLDYFLSSDAIYPEWFKYYAFQGMLKLGSYDKVKESFNKRTNSTTNIFLDLNREALALVYDNLCNVLNGEKVNDEVLQRLLEGGSFSKIYAYMLKKIESSKKNISDSKDGIWIKYNQGSEPDELVKNLDGKGTGWCTAGLETARSQLQGGDFHVYYTKDSNGEYKQPRIAIRMEGSSIGEIRGINNHQSLESEMEEILDKKLEEFPDKDRYKKKVNDMETLTNIYKEYKNRDLTIEELRFLYEVDSDIEGFGYDEDPRIEEILEKRNFKKDLSKVFNCSEEEISNDRKDVLEGKKIVYFYGNLYLGNFINAEYLILPSNIRGYLDLSDLTSAEGLILPNSVRGSLDLSSLISAKGLTLPSTIGGCLDLRSLTNAEGITLPSTIGGYLDLRSLTNAEGITLPSTIGGYLDLCNLKSTEGITLPNNVGDELYLSNLTSAEGLILPNTIGGNLSLRSLTSAEGLTLPNNMNGDLYLSSLASAEGLILPNSVRGSLDLSSLISAESLTLPSIIGEDLVLSNLTNAEGLILPNSVRGSLDLSSLISAEGLTLPSTIGEDLVLSNLTNAEGLTLPNSVGRVLYLDELESTDGLIIPNDFRYSDLFSDYISMQNLIDKSLENSEDKVKNKGFSKTDVLIILNVIASISILIFGSLLIFS